jgi:hypothetical protein
LPLAGTEHIISAICNWSMPTYPELAILTALSYILVFECHTKLPVKFSCHSFTALHMYLHLQSFQAFFVK